jgi:hypothetical protein
VKYAPRLVMEPDQSVAAWSMSISKPMLLQAAPHVLNELRTRLKRGCFTYSWLFRSYSPSQMLRIMSAISTPARAICSRLLRLRSASDSTSP